MELDCRKPTRRVIGVAAAAMLGLALAACGDKPTGETAAPNIEPTADAAAKQAAAAERKKAEEKKPAVDPAKQAADAKAAAERSLAAKVKTAILESPGLKNLAMDVRASGGEVTLFGTADSDAQIERAGKVAAGVPGVSSVKNKLLVVRGS